MKTSNFVAAAVAGLMTLSAAGSAFAYETQDQMITAATEALEAVTQTHAARLALFENDMTAAKTYIDGAFSALSAAENDLDERMIADFDMAGAEAEYLPFDMSMSLTENFSATEENKLALQKAYGLFESAEPDDAIEVLKLAEIDVQVSTAMLPAEATMQHLIAAQGLLEAGKYFETNLELKAIADSIIVRSFSIDAIPAQGDIM